jgi:hypothetical protein
MRPNGMDRYDPKWVTLGTHDRTAQARRQARAVAMIAADTALTDEQRAARNATRDNAPMARYMNDTAVFSIFKS